MDAWDRLTRGSTLANDAEAAQLRRQLDAVRAAWPDVAIDDAALAEALGRALDENRLERPVTESDLRDLVLALACASGDAAGCTRFERLYFAAALAKAKPIVGEAGIGDVEQRLRERFFGASSALPTAVGRGKMRNLVQVAAVRLALTLSDSQRRRGARESRFAAQRREPHGVDPETLLAKAEVRDLTKRSFEQAVESLDDRSRNLLRAHLVERLTIDDLALTYGVHRSTVSRWITHAREQVSSRTRAHLHSGLGPRALDVDDVARLVHSQIDLSLPRVLGDE